MKALLTDFPCVPEIKLATAWGAQTLSSSSRYDIINTNTPPLKHTLSQCNPRLVPAAAKTTSFPASRLHEVIRTLRQHK